MKIEIMKPGEVENAEKGNTNPNLLRSPFCPAPPNLRSLRNGTPIGPKEK